MSNRLLRLSAVVALALMTACSSDGGATTTSPTVEVEDGGPEAPPSTTTTVPVDQIPDEITVEYVQRVMDSLDAAWGDMFRQYKADEGPTPDNLAWLGELYTDDWYSRIESSLGEMAGHQFDGVEDSPGDPSTTVREVFSASSECIFFNGSLDLNEVYDSEGDAVSPSLFIALRARSEGTAANERNPTAWKVAMEAETVGDERPNDPCA